MGGDLVHRHVKTTPRERLAGGLDEEVTGHYLSACATVSGHNLSVCEIKDLFNGFSP